MSTPSSMITSKNFCVSIFLFIMCLSSSSQSIDSTNRGISEKELKIHKVIKNAKIIHQKTFELTFVISTLPDNLLLLALHKDGTYQQKAYSGWGSNEGYVHHKGKYTVSSSLLQLTPSVKPNGQNTLSYYIVRSMLSKYEYGCIDCTRRRLFSYCLYRNFQIN